MNITRTAWLSHGGDENVAVLRRSTRSAARRSTALNLAVQPRRLGRRGGRPGLRRREHEPAARSAPTPSPAPRPGYGKPVSKSYFEPLRVHLASSRAPSGSPTKYGITREETDAFGLESQVRAAGRSTRAASSRRSSRSRSRCVDEEGKRTGETVTVSRDEVPRETSLEAAGQLKPVAREDGIHTAGSSSQIADGAAAVLVMSADEAAQLEGSRRWPASSRHALVGCDPVLMLEGPIPATREDARPGEPHRRRHRRVRDQRGLRLGRARLGVGS